MTAIADGHSFTERAFHGIQARDLPARLKMCLFKSLFGDMVTVQKAMN
jgi:hypothetical protein